jgi:CRP/FNR family cyclic AMP-dependent transcriptional regulator
VNPSSDAGWSADPVIRRMAEDLRRTDVFQMLDAGEAQHVATLCERRLLGPADLLFEEGQLASHLYLVLRGQLQILVRSPDGLAEVVVGVAEAGALVGEMAVLEAMPRSASGRAATTCEVLQLPGRAFAELVASAHPAAFAILRQLQHTLSERLRRLDARIDAVLEGGRPASPRPPHITPSSSAPEPTLWHLIDSSEVQRHTGGGDDSES